MLMYYDNLTQIVDIVEFSDYIDSLIPYKGEYWEIKTDVMKNLKSSIRSQLEQFQKSRCAYCGFEYIAVAYTNIEHIAPKSKYPQFMFEPYNLVAACPLCNGFGKKGTKDTISKVKSKYNECEFIIVHPYYDNPSDHYKYITDEEGIIIQPITNKAKKSIEIFKLNESKMIEMRAKTFVNINTVKSERIRQIEAILNVK